jgi:hypothetical protein
MKRRLDVTLILFLTICFGMYDVSVTDGKWYIRRCEILFVL